jgi:hypothetical protein
MKISKENIIKLLNELAKPENKKKIVILKEDIEELSLKIKTKNENDLKEIKAFNESFKYVVKLRTEGYTNEEIKIDIQEVAERERQSIHLSDQDKILSLFQKKLAKLKKA